MSTEARAWFDRWGVVRKGGPGSGNWGHRGIPGKHGGSAPSSGMSGSGQINQAYFEVGPGKRLLEEIPEDQREDIFWMLSGFGMQPRHLQGLKQITFEAPEGGWITPANKSPTGKEILAGGDYRDGVIRLNPQAGLSKNTLSHEIGHHITEESGWRRSDAGSSGFRTMAKAFEGAKKTPQKLMSMGLREYSLSNLNEFMADVWKVTRRGTRRQYTALSKLLGQDPREMFSG